MTYKELKLMDWKDCLLKTKNQILSTAKSMRESKTFELQAMLSRQLDNLIRIQEIAEKEIEQLKEEIKEEELKQGK